jgi:hypothetical protein
MHQKHGKQMKFFAIGTRGNCGVLPHDPAAAQQWH